jgi:hypothetical protein
LIHRAAVGHPDAALSARKDTLDGLDQPIFGIPVKIVAIGSLALSVAKVVDACLTRD